MLAQTSNTQARPVLEEVIVTARKRSENLQETPIAVSALSGDALRERGITSTQELTKSIPSLQFNAANSNNIYIRGIGERTGRTGIDPTVGVYIDGIYLPRPDGHLLDTIDVSSIQVLRGPQGTLFGKNTTAGALVMTLEKPKEEFESYLEVSLGSYQARSGKFGINIPVSDRFFTKLAINVVKNDGYVKDISGSRSSSDDRKSVMLQTRWDATDSVTVDSLLFASKARQVLPGTNCTSINEEDGLFAGGIYLMWPGDTNPAQPMAYRENCEANSRERLGDLTTNLGPDPPNHNDFDAYMLAGTLEWRVSDNQTLKMIAGWREETKGPFSSSDNDGGPKRFSASYQPGDSDRQMFSTELQLNGSAFNSRLNYTAGLFYMHERYEEPSMSYVSVIGVDASSLVSLALGQIPSQPPEGGTIPFVGVLNGPLVLSEFELDNKAAAAFIQTSWDVTEALQLTAGIRYTADKRSSELLTTPGDVEATIATIEAHPLFGPPAPLIPGGAGGFTQYNGPLGWRDDPVGIAASLFNDADGDGIIDYPLDYNSQTLDKRSEIFREITPMFSVAYNIPYDWLTDSVLDSTMVYATWSRGFKAGFFEPRGTDGLDRIEPEEVENSEVGVKMDALGRSLRLNIAAYQMDFKNMQLIQVQTDSQTNLAVIFQNAGLSRIEGAELELNWLPLPGMMLSFNYSNNNYKFLDFEDLALTPLAIEGRQVPIDRSDEGFPVSPEETAAFGIQYTWNSDFGQITPRLDVSYKSDIYLGVDDGAWTVYQEDTDAAGQQAFTLVDMMISWVNIAGDTRMSFSVKNLTDERYLQGAAAIADSLSIYNQLYGRPRWYGLTFRRDF